MHNKIITPISSTTNQWPQIITLDDHKTNFMASSSATTTLTNANANNKSAAEKANQQDLHPLKCPRCDSSNTKFCYYNNYSLSQPRHFCKACKRYWTRGGTLRNVPVGGGCRKNKRPKRHSAAADSLSSASSNPTSQPHMDLPLSSNNHLHHQNNNSNNNNPLFYGGGLSSNPLELNFPFSSFRVSSSADNSAFDLNALGLGFSSGLADTNGYKNGFKPIQDASAASPFSSSTSNNNSIFFGSSAFSTTASTMASLLASTQKFGAPGLMHYEDPQMAGMGKQQVKAEGENRLAGWNPNPNPHHSQSQSQNQNMSLNPMDQMNNNDSSDPSPLVWNTTSGFGWFDPSTMGSSVPSLI